jgi:predicted DCC family thiol-disulfide oxidoreductase YuxK
MNASDNIVFFDGVCNFCNGTVNWLMARNKRRNILFSSLQGSTAKRLLPNEMLVDLSSIVYYRKGSIHTKSTAVLFICKDMAWYGGAVLPFLLVPRFVRDGVYNWVARNRYKWFGKSDACRIPTAAERACFLD